MRKYANESDKTIGKRWMDRAIVAENKIAVLEDCLRDCEKSLNNSISVHNPNGLSLQNLMRISEESKSTLRAVLGTK